MSDDRKGQIGGLSREEVDRLRDRENLNPPPAERRTASPVPIGDAIAGVLAPSDGPRCACCGLAGDVMCPECAKSRRLYAMIFESPKRRHVYPGPCPLHHPDRFDMTPDDLRDEPRHEPEEGE